MLDTRALKPEPVALVVPRVSEAPQVAPHAAGRGGAPLRIAGYASLGVGAVGVGVGLLGGLFTMNAKSTADANCQANGCNGAGLDAESRGKTWGAVSTASLIVGGAGLAAGAGLLLFSPAQKTMGGVIARPVAGGGEVRWVTGF